MANVKDVTCVYWDTPVDIGDTCRVGVQFMYQGAATTKKIYAAIGNDHWWGFDEVLSAEKDLFVPASYPEGSWNSYLTYVNIPITSKIDSGRYDLYAKVRIATIGWELSPIYKDVIEVGEAPPEEIIDFSLSEPTAYPYRAPPGPVLITCPVASQSTQSVTAQVKCLVYEGSIFPGHGTKLWEDTKSVTFAPGETKDIQFMRTSIVGTIDRRDVEVEVRVGGQLIVEEEWDDVYYVTEEEEPPPEEGTFSGVITEVKPLRFEFGELVKLLVSFTAFARNWPAQILWETRVTATLDGLSGSDSQNHTGEDGSRDEQPLHLGAMPNRNLTGEVILEARVGWPYSWTKLYRIPISVTVGVEPPPPPPVECVIGARKCERGDLYECVSGPDYNYWELIEENSPECEGKEFPWLPVALIGGGVLVVGAALAKKPKK